MPPVRICKIQPVSYYIDKDGPRKERFAKIVNFLHVAAVYLPVGVINKPVVEKLLHFKREQL
jgi:hypothetical protein